MRLERVLTVAAVVGVSVFGLLEAAQSAAVAAASLLVGGATQPSVVFGVFSASSSVRW